MQYGYMLTRLVSYLNARSLMVLACGVTIGLVFPGLAELFRPLLGPAVFMFLLGTFLRTDPSSLQSAFGKMRTSVWLPVFIILGVPALLAGSLTMIGVEAFLVTAIVLTAACPPSTANAPMARAIGGDHSTALVIVLVCTFLSPLTIPLIASNWLNLDLSAAILGRNVAFYILGSCALATIAILFAKPVVDRSGDALDVVVTVALVVFAIGCMENVQGQIMDNPMRAAMVITIAYAINIVSLLIGALLSHGTFTQRMSYGFPCANRNVGLVWAALGTSVDQTITFYFALTQVPIFTLPAIMQFFVGRLSRTQRDAAARDA